MLLEEGLITETQLNQALVDHKRSGLKLGQYLIRQNIVRESQIMDMISRQLKIEKFTNEKYPVDQSLAPLIPADIARRFHVVPLRKKGNLFTIGMNDPMDIQAIDAIEALTNLEVEAVICTENELNQMTGRIYGMYSDLGNALDSVSDVKVEGHEEEDEVETEEEQIITSTEDLEVSSLQGMAEEAPVIRLVNSILSQAIREKASDVHMSPEKNYVQIRFRVDGKLHEVPSPPKSMFLPIVSRLKILANMDIAVSRIPQDGRFTIKMENKEINIRASALPTIHGENVVLRLLDMSSGVYSLDLLGMNPKDQEQIESVIRKPYGMILSTGPTGSGKSTSLYSILKEINQPDINIITLEDPVEYRVANIRQVQLNRRAGMTFASGLRSILRQDPDVLMVGEIRDAETATIAVQAAMTGHRVLSTVHTNDAAGAITRFIDMGVEPFLVASVMLVSFAQRLVRKICPHCKEEYRPSDSILRQWGLDNVAGVNDLKFYRSGGCFRCMDTGYMGRTGVFEVLVIDEVVQDMILERRSAQEITRAAKQSGKLRTLKDDALEKAMRGITTLEEAATAVLT